MSTVPGVPVVPASVSSDPALEAFTAVWQRVLAWDAADGLRPLSGPHTVLAVTDDALSTMTPCDVSDPFMVDRQLQRALIRRHVLPESVPPADGRFAAGGRAATLDGGQLTLSRQDDKPAFKYEDQQPAVARPVPGEDDGTAVYVVTTPFVTCSEISDAIGRHPQENPFHPPEPVLEPPQ